jgi:hypothetical protein
VRTRSDADIGWNQENPWIMQKKKSWAFKQANKVVP